MSQPTLSAAPRPVLWTSAQLRWAVAQAVLLASLAAGLLLLQFDYAGVLFTHPLGRKVLAGALGMAVAGFAIQLAAAAGLNCWLPPGDETRRGLRAVVSWALGAVLFVVFYLPVVFVLLIGPASIHIREAITNMP
ncbi:MAG TPA: hypothetical protein VFA26_22045 [Gemmataceae bacterium]|nr:hypothetical protein [Gemmataceae bacterium]